MREDSHVLALLQRDASGPTSTPTTRHLVTAVAEINQHSFRSVAVSVAMPCFRQTALRVSTQYENAPSSPSSESGIDVTSLRHSCHYNVLNARQRNTKHGRLKQTSTHRFPQPHPCCSRGVSCTRQNPLLQRFMPALPQ